MKTQVLPITPESVALAAHSTREIPSNSSMLPLFISFLKYHSTIV